MIQNVYAKTNVNVQGQYFSRAEFISFINVLYSSRSIKPSNYGGYLIS